MHGLPVTGRGGPWHKQPAQRAGSVTTASHGLTPPHSLAQPHAATRRLRHWTLCPVIRSDVRAREARMNMAGGAPQPYPDRGVGRSLARRQSLHAQGGPRCQPGHHDGRVHFPRPGLRPRRLHEPRAAGDSDPRDRYRDGVRVGHDRRHQRCRLGDSGSRRVA